MANTVEIYCDGSYNTTTKKAGYCALVVINGEAHCKLTGTIDNPMSRQIDGECTAFIHALHYCRNIGFHNPIIYYDYEGIARWYNGEWKAKTDIAKKFVLALVKYGMVKPELRKVSGHSSYTPRFHKLADNFAKNKTL